LESRIADDVKRQEEAQKYLDAFADIK